MNKRALVGVTVISLMCIGVQVANAGTPPKSEVAQSLAYSGCTFGLVSDPSKYDFSTQLDLTSYADLLISLIDQGLATNQLSSFANNRIRTGIDHVKQSWITAGALDSKWKPLNQSLTQGVNLGIKKWNSGSTFAASQKAANALSNPTLVSLCRVAEIGVKEKSGKTFTEIQKYVKKTAGKYLPPLPSKT